MGHAIYARMSADDHYSFLVLVGLVLFTLALTRVLKLSMPLTLMLAPVAPHIAEELWSRLGHAESLAHGPFPVAEGQWLVQDTVEIPVQVKGKVRARITVGADASEHSIVGARITACFCDKFPSACSCVAPARSECKSD